MREMKLNLIEQNFNLTYNFEKVKRQTSELLEELVRKSSTNFLKEESSNLPKGLSYSDLKIRYKQVNIFLNNFDRDIPYFRVCFELIHPKTEIQIFYYDVDYDIDGNFSDEYFGRY